MKRIVILIIVIIAVISAGLYSILSINTLPEIDFNEIHTIVDTDTLEIKKSALYLEINDITGENTYKYKKAYTGKTGTKQELSINKNTDTIRIIQLNGNQFLVEDYASNELYLFYF